LEGADTEWQPIKTQNSQRYPSLSPGRYAFKVTGSNGDGYWNTKGVSLEFEIMPPFWDTWWFWSLTAALAFGLVIGAYQYRVHQLRQTEQTRSRIADDLHDDIGSKMSSIALMVEMVANTLALDQDQKGQIAEISRTARAVVDDLRDAIWIVDAENDDLTALIERMKQVAAQMLREHSFKLQIDDTLPSVTVRMEQRRNILLSYREMLHNVVRHAHASHVDIWITYEREAFNFKVSDNGTGFDPLSVSYGRGLRNIQRRAKLLGGSFQVVSKQGEGTKQSFTAKLV
jgi:signal transduction histidine kinase